MSDAELTQDTLVTLTADIVSAHVSNNSVSVGDVSTLISSVYAALTGLASPVEAPAVVQEPAVSDRKSVV